MLAIALHGEGVFAACVARQAEGKPKVMLAAFYAADKADKASTPDMLEKTGKDLHANNYRCATLLGAGEYQLLSVEAPNVPADELRTAVRWRLKDMLDFPADQAGIDVLDIPTDKGRSQSIFAVAARNSLIESRQNRFVDAGVALAVIDIPEMAQRNISALVEPEGRGVAMLSFSSEGGLLTVTFNGELYLARRIDVTLEQLLDSDHDRKHACYDKITLELQRSLDHFDRQYNFINVSKLVLAPTGASGLDEYLSSNLYTRVESLDLAAVLDLGGITELAAPAQQQRFFLTLGAALRQEEAAT